MKPSCRLTVLAALFAAVAAGAQAQPQYLVGGPLAGLVLPRHPRAQGPEVELYPGAAERYRAYFHKYLPVRSFWDAQSLVKQWVAPEIPGAEPALVEQYAPLGQAPHARPVVRASVAKPLIRLDLGQLPAGMYALRVIGAGDPQKIRRFREPLYLGLRVNDSTDGKVSTYRKRISYTNDFYSVCEFYFHTPEQRNYWAHLWVDQGSTVDLLIQAINLDDMLAGAVRRPLKPAMTATSAEQVALWKAEAAENPDLQKILAALPQLTPEQRLDRDEAIWNYLPPINAQGAWLDYNVAVPGVEKGVADKTLAEIEAEYGKWEAAPASNYNFGGTLYFNPATWNGLLINKKLNAVYTMDDLRAGRPLPEAYPYREDPAGLFYPDPANPAKGRRLDNIAQVVGLRLRSGYGVASNMSKMWLQTGNELVGRDAAISLIRFAYDYPSIDSANWFDALTTGPGAYDRDTRFVHREDAARWMPHYANYIDPLYAYDRLYDYIKGNEELARSVSRFVPAVKTSADVIALLDTYLVQHGAKRILRYQDYTDPMEITRAAVILGEPKVTAPWMDWQFSRTFVYPLQPAGIQDLMISGTDRSGPEYIGSTYYSQGEGAKRTAAALVPYLKLGGDPKYDLADQKLYPKPLAHARWQLDTVVGGADFLRIGDVTGPDKPLFLTLRDTTDAARLGWGWSREPRFAWLLANLVGRSSETDAEWAEITAAAAKVPRAPWLDNPSRSIENWAAVLETGHQHDDFRFRRAAWIRTGLGFGHEHADSLDLGLVAHGLPMTIDLGQRSGYTKPNSKFSRVHNTMEVNGGGNIEYGQRAYAYTETLSDAPGARFTTAVGDPPPGATLFARQVALIDVDEGQGSAPLPLAQQRPGAALPKGVTTGNSYVVDVFRVAGGQLHSYGFHGPVEDEFTTNALNRRPVQHIASTRKQDDDAGQLSIFELNPEAKTAGDAPPVLEANWRYSRTGRIGTEQAMAGGNYDPESPRKFTKLHILDAQGGRVLTADAVTTHPGIEHRFTHLLFQRRGDNLQTANLAIIEPYAGAPFISSVRSLRVGNNDSGATRAVAAEVVTANGRTDLVFADGQPEQTREVEGHRFAGEFGYVSTDTQGLRQASLTGGTLLDTSTIRLQPAARAHQGTIIALDYGARTVTLDRAWPPLPAGAVVQVGSPTRMTSYTLARAEGDTLTMTHGADLYRSTATRIVPDQNIIDCNLNIPTGVVPGGGKGIPASNDQQTKFFRMDHSGGNDFKVSAGGPVTAADLAPSNVLRLWEYGVGDTVRRKTYVSLRRVAANTYEVVGDVDVTVALPGRGLATSADGKSWDTAGTRATGGWATVKLTAAELLRGRVMVRVQ